MAVGAGLAVSAVLTACGSDHSDEGSASKASVPATADHNAADVVFAQGMIPHHEQAIEMAELVPSRSTRAEVKDLAVRIKGAQDPEIASMKGWLTSWGEPTSMPGGDHASHGMSGMMTDADMKALTAASGPAFDKLFLDMMIRHHEGAVTMARTELTAGKFQPAKDLAQAIITGQEKEIAEMRALLAAG